MTMESLLARSLTDPFGRTVTYVRVSVTDRCNLRCTYCMSEDMKFLPKAQLLSLEELDSLHDQSAATEVDPIELLDRDRARNKLLSLVRALQPLDRQIILLYLEGTDAASIGDVTGISPGNGATKIHRIKQILIRRVHEGVNNDRR